VVGCCEYGDEPSGSGAMELASCCCILLSLRHCHSYVVIFFGLSAVSNFCNVTVMNDIYTQKCLLQHTLQILFMLILFSWS
jgi:hypothetical protein